MDVSLRTMPAVGRDRREADIAGKWADLFPHLDERSRRLWLGAEARLLGYGGIKFVACATGAAIETVRGGLADLGRNPAEGPAGRVRRAGGGRKKAEAKTPDLQGALDGLLDGEAAGDPMTLRLRWTSRSLVNLSGQLRAMGFAASPTLVRRLMRQTGWRMQSNSKSIEKAARHPDRDAQFRYINSLVAMFTQDGQPVVSIDAKKKDCDALSHVVSECVEGGSEGAACRQDHAAGRRHVRPAPPRARRSPHSSHLPTSGPP